MKELKAYCNAIELAEYINKKHKDKTGMDISNIKLQKSLYFLFAYWGGFVRKSFNTEQVEIKINTERLFDEKIEAWVYGPVIPDVYYHFTRNNFEKDKKRLDEIEKAIGRESIVKEFIDDLLEDLFKISDFKLVDIAHEDSCWQKYYKYYEEKHNNEIPKEEIIVEYSKKQ